MKILVALGTTAQDSFVVNEVARLAGNTWADVTLLGIETVTSSEVPPFSASLQADEVHPLVQALRDLRGRFLSQFKAEESPYKAEASAHEVVKVENNLWEDLNVLRSAPKQLITRIRPGNPARAILTEAKQFPCDLIVFGNSLDGNASDIGRKSKKVIHEADTSVLVVAKTKQPRRIVACLDHDRVSQYSLEMINQMVTLYQADLEIVGVSATEALPGEVDDKMTQILKYYANNGIKTLVRTVPRNSLEAFVAQASRGNLVALWMGRQSLLHRVISPKGMDRLLDSSDYSVLILR